MLFCRLRLKFKIKIKKIIKKKNMQKIKTKKTTTKTNEQHTHKKKKINKKAHEKIQPQKLKCIKTLLESLPWDSNSCEFFRLIKHVKIKQLKLVLDFTCNNIFTQQFGTITAITLKIFKLLFMIFYAALWLKWNKKLSILLNVLSESFNTHR